MTERRPRASRRSSKYMSERDDFRFGSGRNDYL